MYKPVVTIFDRKANACTGLYVVASLAVAMRMFADTLSEENTMAQHPEDFAMFQVGEFNAEGLVGGEYGTGHLIGERWDIVVEAAELVRRKSMPPSNGELPGQLPLGLGKVVEDGVS